MTDDIKKAEEFDIVKASAELASMSVEVDNLSNLLRSFWKDFPLPDEEWNKVKGDWQRRINETFST